MIPCTSWFGHKYQPRYSTKQFLAPMGKYSGLWPEQFVEIIEAHTMENVEYHCDVCIRCGHTVNHFNPPPTTGA